MNNSKALYPLFLENRLKNERGYVTIVTVTGVLLLLTVVSLSMISTSINDQQIVRNDKLNKRNFYLGESGANEAAQRIENAATTEADPTASIAWVVNQSDPAFFENKDYWRNASTNYAWYMANNLTPPNITIASIPSGNFYALANPTVANSNQVLAGSNLEVFQNAAVHRDDIHLAANFEGVAGGSSLVVTGTAGRLYAYQVFGMYSSQINGLGEALIEEGYRKRF